MNAPNTETPFEAWAARQGIQMTSVDVTDPAHFAAELAAAINAEHQAAERTARTALDHARAAGDKLLQAKALVEHGQWLPWLSANCPDVAVRTAQAYMQLSRNWGTLQAKYATVAYLPINDALKLLNAPEPDSDPITGDLLPEADPATVIELQQRHIEALEQRIDAEYRITAGLEPPATPAPAVSAEQNQQAVLDTALPPAPMVLVDQWAALTAAEKISVIQPLDSKSGFNRQENDSIEWAQWSWNPVTGCKAGCSFCYARDIADRFYPQKFEPAFHPCRLLAPARGKIPDSATNDVSYKNVFTCSMADLFGRWVPAEWIEAVLTQVRNNPQWNFLFLTKYPKRLNEFEFPANAWLGATVDCQARVKAAEDAFERITGGTKWLSIEPMLQPLTFTRLALFDWVVIGGASRSTQTPEWTPPFDWVVALHNQARAAGCRIYHKANLGLTAEMRLKEFPWTTPVEKPLPVALQYMASLGTTQ